MSEITNPPTVPEISTPVPQRTDPENFSVLMDRFLREMPVTVDGINIAVQWTYDTTQVVKEFSQAAAKSVDGAAQQVELAKKEVQLAKQEASKARDFAQDSAVSAAASEQAREDITNLIEVVTGELGLPSDGTTGAPLLKTTEGLGFDLYPLGTHARANTTPRIEVKDDYLAQAYQTIGVDARFSRVGITLPAYPVVGDRILFYDATSRRDRWKGFDILRNGSKIMGKEEDLAGDLRGFRFVLEFFGLERGWVIAV